MNTNLFSYFVGRPDGKDLGPYSFQQMKRKIRSGEVDAATCVKRSDGSVWSTPSAFPEFGLRHWVSDLTSKSPLAQDRDREFTVAIHHLRPVRNSAIWFFWIGLFSMINTVIVHMGGHWGWALGLELTYWMTDVGNVLGSGYANWFFGFNLFLSFLFLCFGVASWNGRFGPFLLGFSIYAGDTILSILHADIVSMSVHLIGLVFLFLGLKFLVRITQRSWLPTLSTATPIMLLTASMAVALVNYYPRLTGLPLAPWMRDASTPVAQEPWMQLPPKDWPQILLTHQAEFQNHGTLSGASAFLLKVPSGEAIALTPKHLIGIHGGLPGMHLKDLDKTLLHWKLSAPGNHSSALDVVRLIGLPEHYESTGDVIALQLANPDENLLIQPLQIRSKPVTQNEKIWVVGSRSRVGGPQHVYSGTVTGNSGFLLDGSLDATPDFAQFSGAPLVDDQGKIMGRILSESGQKPNGPALPFEGFTGSPILDQNGYVVGILTAGARVNNPDKSRGFTAHSILELDKILQAHSDSITYNKESSTLLKNLRVVSGKAQDRVGGLFDRLLVAWN